MESSTGGRRPGSSAFPRVSGRLRGCCALLLAAVVLLTIATSSAPVAVEFLSSQSKRSLKETPSSSSSSPPSSPSPRSQTPRRPGHKQSVNTGRHDGAGGIAPTPSLSSAAMEARSGNPGDSAQGIHLLLRPPDLLAPSQVPHLHGNGPPVTPVAPPTRKSVVPPPEDHLYPAHTMEVDWLHTHDLGADWGSGDYLETLTFMGSEGEELSLVTALPTHGYDPYDLDNDLAGAAGVVYDTAFPSRPLLALSSRHLLLPSVTAGHGDALRTAHPADPRLPVNPDPALSSEADADLDFDWSELFPIEPTEMLLPDMNSLEYYNTLQAKGNGSKAENRTRTPPSGPAPPRIAPTRPAGPPPMLAPTIGGEGAAASPPGPGTSPQPKPSAAPPSGIRPDPPPTGPRKPPSRPGMGAPRPPSSTASSATSQGPEVQAVTLKPPTGPKAPRTPPPKTTTTTPPPKTTTTSLSTRASLPTTPRTPLSTRAPLPTTPRTPLSTTSRQILCNITRSDMYLVRVALQAMPSEVTVAVAKSHVREILRQEFNRSVELQVRKDPPNFIFRAVSGPVVFTSVSVINTLRQSARSTASSTILAVTPIYPVPHYKYQVHSVLQFVPSHVDVRVCSFSERVERGLLMAYAEVRRRSQETGNFTVHIMNITSSLPRGQRQQKAPVDITFTVRDGRNFLKGSEVAAHLRQLNMVEFSFYLGFPALQIAEPFHYPELNVTYLLRSSWVKTVLLGVLDQRVSERTFQAKMERRLALLVGEGLGLGRRWRRATTVGNSSVQVVRASRLEGANHPLELVYFVEGGSGERLPARTTATMLNRLDLQRAAIVLGYRVHGKILAQPVEKLALPPSETQANNVWLIVGVVVPVLVVILIIIILYVKLCRSEKLEFQPDAMSTIQQRHPSKWTPEMIEGLQAPSVKGFDFAKLHLGQHSKDDIMVIQEPAPLPPSVKEATPSEGGELNTPKSKGSSTKASRATRRRGRLSPSDGDSLGSEASSGRESAEESTRPAITPSEGKPHRKTKHGKNKIGAPSGSGGDEQLSSSSIFEHVDRMSRGSSDGTRRVSNKIQLIAMQPMPSPPPHNHDHSPNPALSPAFTERVPDGAKVSSEIQVALRHKSEIEHHRNKIRLRAKRKGHYDFPSMDDIMAAFGDSLEQQRVYEQAQHQIHMILHPDAHTPPPCGEPRKRGRRSPRHRRRQHLNGSLNDKDRLIADGDGTYRKYPGVNNVAYVSDPDQLPDAGSLSPSDEVFVDPGTPPPGPAPNPPAPPAYVPPQSTIEEARQQMHSLLDDAFALVSPSSQGSSAPLTLSGVTRVTEGVGGVSPPPRPVRQWNSSSYPAAPAHSPFCARYEELGMSPTSVQGLLQSEALGSGYLVPTELQSEGVYSSRGQYSEDLPSSSRPRPVGGSTGAQLHQLTQVGLSSRIGVYPGVGRSVSGPSGSSWAQYHSDDEISRPGPNSDPILSFPEYSSSVFGMPRTSLRDPATPAALLDSPMPGYPSTPTPGYPPTPLEEPSPPSHSSASLIKAIREELQRLSQKQVVVAGYHS